MNETPWVDGRISRDCKFCHVNAITRSCVQPHKQRQFFIQKMAYSCTSYVGVMSASDYDATIPTVAYQSGSIAPSGPVRIAKGDGTLTPVAFDAYWCACPSGGLQSCAATSGVVVSPQTAALQPFVESSFFGKFTTIAGFPRGAWPITGNPTLPLPTTPLPNYLLTGAGNSFVASTPTLSFGQPMAQVVIYFARTSDPALLPLGSIEVGVQMIGKVPPASSSSSSSTASSPAPAAAKLKAAATRVLGATVATLNLPNKSTPATLNLPPAGGPAPAYGPPAPAKFIGIGTLNSPTYPKSWDVYKTTSGGLRVVHIDLSTADEVCPFIVITAPTAAITGLYVKAGGNGTFGVQAITATSTLPSPDGPTIPFLLNNVQTVAQATAAFNKLVKNSLSLTIVLSVLGGIILIALLVMIIRGR